MQSPSPLQQRLWLLQQPRHIYPRPFLSASPPRNNRFPFSPLYLSFPARARALPGGGEDSSKQTEPSTRLGKDSNFSDVSIDTRVVLSSCLVGLLTGIAVVLFNNAVHELRDLLWDGIPHRGASWLREEPLHSNWARVVLVPAAGGLAVAALNQLRSSLPDSSALLRPVLKALSASFTLGTGNSLGPEGPSVEIGASIAKAIGASQPDSNTKLSLLAAGSAAGLSSGFNAAVAGCFFAVESVLWPSPSDSSSVSLTNTTSMVILSAVIASVVSQVGLGSEPAFKVPDYDFRSPSELPLYLLLGILCGLVSLALSRCTSFMIFAANKLHEDAGMPRAAYPVIGSLATGVIALAYPEILYWGFENVDVLLESRPFVKGLSADLLVQLVGVKIVATSLCRASGLVGGYYAPSLFIGAATGMAYGKLIALAVAQSHITDQLSILELEVASPQAYGLVGMAATLAGVCQVPLTAVLLMFELTHDYRIVLPLLGAVGLSSWVTSGQMKRDGRDVMKKQESTNPTTRTRNNKGTSSSDARLPPTTASDLCEIEASLCMDDSVFTSPASSKPILVSQAMRTRYVAISMNTLLGEAVRLMLEEKQSCAVILDHDGALIGLLTLEDIENFIKTVKSGSWKLEEFPVSELCSSGARACEVPWTVNPSMDLLSAQQMMDRHGFDQVPVVSESLRGGRDYLVGLLDRECIDFTRRFLSSNILS
ncbi:unnamed protein product [Linum trigynum]|uniref:Chloride channel protein n=1 Tax=Linum trigynum TaxID=586398 RepID=A0AAV2DIZ0_9ROSI